MPRLSPSRTVVITSIFIALTAIAAGANWAGAFGLDLFKPNAALAAGTEALADKRAPASGSVSTPDPSDAVATIGFAGTGSLAAVRVSHTATLLSNGKVLVAGGRSNLSYLSSAE